MSDISCVCDESAVTVSTMTVLDVLKTETATVPAVLRYRQGDGTDSFVTLDWYATTIAPLCAVQEARTWGDAAAIVGPTWLTDRIAAVCGEHLRAGVDLRDTSFCLAHLEFTVSDLWEAIDVPWGTDGLPSTISEQLRLGAFDAIIECDLLGEVEELVELLAIPARS